MTQLTTQNLEDYFRAHPHAVSLYMSVLVPEVVYCGTVDGDHSFGSIEITVADDSGSLGDSISGMTVLVGTECGDKSISKRRLRSVSGQVITLDENSVAWSDGDYITILKAWELWPVYPYIDAQNDYEFYKDYDIAYSDQNEFPNPVAVMGPHRAMFLDGASVSIDLDASDSYVVADGASIASLLWECDEGTIADDTAATTTIEFTTAGVRWVYLTVTDDNGKEQTTRRVIFVHERTGSSAPYGDFSLESLSGDWGSGGWSAEIRVFGNADQTEFPDNALIVVWTESYVDGQLRDTIGSDYDNVFVGYIQEETITKELDTGTILFSAGTINKLMDITKMFSVSLEYDDSPSEWYQFKDLTVARACHHFWKWHSTLFEVTDVYLPMYDTKLLDAVDDFEDGSIYSIVETFAYGHGIFAHSCCNRVGALYMEVDASMHDDADRSTYVADAWVMEDSDRKGDVDVEVLRNTLERISYITLSGTYFDGSDSEPYCAQAPGNVPEPHGDITTFDRIVLGSQAHANFLVGKLLKISNRKIIEVRVPLSGNYIHALDIVPQEFVEMNIPASDTKRGIAIEGNFVPRNIEISIDNGEGLVEETVVFEPETVDGVDGVFWQCVGDPAYIQPDPFNPQLPDIPVPPAPPPIEFPDPIPEDPEPELPANLVYAIYAGGAASPDAAGLILRTYNFWDDVPTWEHVPFVAGELIKFFNLDPFDPLNKAYIMTTAQEMYSTSDLNSASPTWTKIISDVQMDYIIGNAAYTIRDFVASVKFPGAFYWIGNSTTGLFIAYTHDSFATKYGVHSPGITSPPWSLALNFASSTPFSQMFAGRNGTILKSDNGLVFATTISSTEFWNGVTIASGRENRALYNVGDIAGGTTKIEHGDFGTGTFTDVTYSKAGVMYASRFNQPGQSNRIIRYNPVIDRYCAFLNDVTAGGGGGNRTEDTVFLTMDPDTLVWQERFMFDSACLCLHPVYGTSLKFVGFNFYEDPTTFESYFLPTGSDDGGFNWSVDKVSNMSVVAGADIDADIGAQVTIQAVPVV